MLHGNTGLADRWRWVSDRLPAGEGAVLDVGCGSGAMALGLAARGYAVTGVTNEPRDRDVAEERARICRLPATFAVADVSRAGALSAYRGRFDVVLCLEVIEHVERDDDLVSGLAACLRPGGRLLLSTAFLPWATPPDGVGGGHVRAGYTPERLVAMVAREGFAGIEVSFCTGPVSDAVARVNAVLNERVSPLVGWVATLPLRPLARLDGVVGRVSRRWVSVCVDAVK